MAEHRSRSCVVEYHVDAFSANRSDLKGRHSAGAGFLRGLARHVTADTLYAVAHGPAAQDFEQTMRQSGWTRGLRTLRSILAPELAEVGTLFCPYPNLSAVAWARQQADARAFSVVGITHTICSDSVLHGFYETLVSPFQPWDAIICTSRPARAAMEAHLDRGAAFLEARFGAARVPKPALPVIPLGIVTEDFALPDAGGRRARMRAKLGLQDDMVTALFVGRLAFHAKAHPLAMFQALNKAAERTGRPVALLLAGRFPGKEIADAYHSMAAAECPSVRVVFVDGADDQAMADVWQAADFFVSPSDNIQETFGLTVVEAMAAGLPVVASDWDGYRDTVEDGVTGFLIPTLGCPEGADATLGSLYFAGNLTFDRYIGYVSLITAVDVGAMEDACVRLIADPDLRARMGAAARDRARRLYDWSVVIGQYQELWARMAELRREGPALEAPTLQRPPMETFAAFPTARLDRDRRIRLRPDHGTVLPRRNAHPMNNYGGGLVFRTETARAVLRLLERDGALSIAQIATAAPGLDEAEAGRFVMWLLKLGVAEWVA